MKWMKRWFLSAALTTACLAPVSAATIADSAADWSSSGTQGENGWFNGWYNLTTDGDGAYASADFQPFQNDGSNDIQPDGANHWNGNAWALYRDSAAVGLGETGPWTTINQTGGHPNGLNSTPPTAVDDPQAAEHWAIRRWVSTYAGPVSAISTLAHTNVNCGNGTSVELYLNGTRVDKVTNISNVPHSNTVGLTLKKGDILDFALTPEGIDSQRGDGCDGSDFNLTLTDEPPPPPPTPPMADSLADWSTTGTQGEKNWFNGYYNLTQDDDSKYQMSDFTPFTNSAGPGGGAVSPDGNHWSGTQWDLDPSGGPWTELGPSNTHPNGTNSFPNDEHWTVRRYVANDLTGTTPLEITWEMAKSNLGGGNGVGGILFINGQQVDATTVAFNDGTGVSRKFYVNANKGDVIDLALTPNGNDGADGSRNRLVLSTELPDGPLYNPGEKIADSVNDFSETQGEKNWFYGYYDQRTDAESGDGKYAPGEFIPFLNDGSGVVSDDSTIGGWKDSENHWDGSKWDLLANGTTLHGPWTEITNTGGHPAANAQSDPEVHWAMRRWVASEGGDFEITGLLNNGSANGDGTVGRILVNGTEVWSAASNGTSVPLDVTVSLAKGALVDFAIDPDGAGNYDSANPSTIDLVNDGSDGTTFYFSISKAPILFLPAGGIPGDYNGDGQLTAADIDALSTAVRGGAADAKYDLNHDSSVDDSDREKWVVDLKKTFYGDANLDGQFNSDDFVEVFIVGKYETGSSASWGEGDWDGDGQFTSADFVAAFVMGGYEQGPRAGVAAVPEPASWTLLSGAVLGLLGRRRRR